MLLLVGLLSHLLTESEVQPLLILVKLLLPLVLLPLEGHMSFFNLNLFFSFFLLTGEIAQLFVQFKSLNDLPSHYSSAGRYRMFLINLIVSPWLHFVYNLLC